MRTRTSTHLLCALLAALALVGVAAPIGAQSSSPGPSADSVDFERYGGADRYATSLEIADAVLADARSAEWAVMVSGESWPDAVVASSLAGALGAPVLLTPPGLLRDDTEAYLQRAGITKVMVVGSVDSPGVSGAVVSALAAEGYAVERIGDDTPSGTSIAVARRLTKALGSRLSTSASVGSMPGFGETAILASSEAFADALVAGPASAYGGHPVLLTSPGRLDADISTYLAEAAVKHVVLMGGTAALHAPIEQALAAMGLEVSRLAGATRFETAVLMSELIHERYVERGGRSCFVHSDVGLARAVVPFDSFGAAPLLARRCAPLLLTDSTRTNPATDARLDGIARGVAASGNARLQVHVFGGAAAVAPAVLSAYFGSSDEATATHAASSSMCGDDDLTRVDLATTDAMYNVVWSPDCERLAYLRPHGDLWIADGDGSNARRILGPKVYTTSPAWSPDGNRIAFGKPDFSAGVYTKHIHVINADGSGRRQLTSGEVNDDTPSWSPDGKRLVFRRRVGVGADHSPESYDQAQHLVVLDMESRKEIALLEGGEPEFTPAWSPDGKRIAFVTYTGLWVADADGSDARIVSGDGSIWRGASWSPDSKRLAVVRIRNPAQGGSKVVILDADGISEELVPIPDFANTPQPNSYWPDRAPHWSLDGRRLFFHLSSVNPFVVKSPPLNWVSVVAVPDAGPPIRSDCRLKVTSTAYTTGFPLPSSAAPAIGTLRVAVLFVDFPDAIARYSTEAELRSSQNYFMQYFEHSSGGRLDIEVVPHHVWLRAHHDVAHYVNERFYGGLVDQRISEHAVELADATFDFSGIDIVLTVMPSTMFGDGGNEGFGVSADGNTMRAIRINHRREGDGRWHDGSLRYPSVNPWGGVAVHEMLHSMGLVDLYWEHTLGFRLWPIGDPLAPPPLPEGEGWALIEFGPLGLNGYHRVMGNGGLRDRRLEMLAWSKWQLGWLNPGQVTCVNSDSVTARLKPSAESGEATAMAAVQLSPRAAVVVESRRLVGYDEPSQHRREEVAAGRRDPQYLAEGVLVYVVTTSRHGHPVSLVYDNGRGYLKDFPLLDVGDSVSVAGYTISVVGDTGTEHIVSIRKND